MIRFLVCAAVVATLGVVSGAQSGEKDAPKKAAGKAGPLELRLVAKKAEYTLDLGGKTPQQFRKMIEDALKATKVGRDAKIPPAPAVDLVLEIHNPTDKAVTAYVGGDYTLTLQLKGPGAMTVAYPAAFTADIKPSKAVTIAPGKSHSIPLKSLEHGFRGYGVRSYWIEPGEYTLTAGYSARGAGETTFNVSGASVKLHVTEKK